MAKTVAASKVHADWMKDPEYQAAFEASELKNQVARAILKARSGANMTQEELATRMGTSRTTITRLEGGQQLPTLATLNRVALVTGQSISFTVDPAWSTRTAKGARTAA